MAAGEKTLRKYPHWDDAITKKLIYKCWTHVTQKFINEKVATTPERLQAVKDVKALIVEICRRKYDSCGAGQICVRKFKVLALRSVDVTVENVKLHALLVSN